MNALKCSRKNHGVAETIWVCECTRIHSTERAAELCCQDLFRVFGQEVFQGLQPLLATDASDQLIALKVREIFASPIVLDLLLQ